jgi:O-methyltransferase
MDLKEVRQRLFRENQYVINEYMRYLGRKRGIDVLMDEYIRNSCLELAAHEIAVNGVPGDVAELGVYQGEFASVMNRVFPDRRLYLLDTFGGFDPGEAEEDRRKGYSQGSQDFSDTTVEEVLAKMPHRDMCEVVKGRFPETAQNLPDTFCFVSIDVDLYEPTMAGLEFFHPRLSKGGYLFVHDFNNAEYRGVKDAVREFCKSRDVSLTPICDCCGTAVIVK